MNSSRFFGYVLLQGELLGGLLSLRRAFGETRPSGGSSHPSRSP